MQGISSANFYGYVNRRVTLRRNNFRTALPHWANFLGTLLSKFSTSFLEKCQQIFDRNGHVLCRNRFGPIYSHKLVQHAGTSKLEVTERESADLKPAVPQRISEIVSTSHHVRLLRSQHLAGLTKVSLT